MNQLPNESSSIRDVICPSCGSRHVSTSTETDSFEYDDKGEIAKLSVIVQVHHCTNCGVSFTDEDASEARHDAVCKYLGVMTPRSIRGIRERYGMTQAEFSEISRIGKASLARWEGGLLVQNQANDNLLYLLTYRENLDRLKKRLSTNAELAVREPKSKINILSFRPKFRTLKEPDVASLKNEAAKFELFPMVVSS